MKKIVHQHIFFYALTAANFCSWSPELLSAAPIRPLQQVFRKIDSATRHQKKPTTVLVYFAARNDLSPFSDRNLMQLMQVGCNLNLNIVAHLDIIGPGRKKITRRLIIYKNEIVQAGEDMAMDSGDPATLINACGWALQNFPSDMFVLVLWNHGTGDLEYGQGRAINPSELYHYNPESKMIELDRSIEFIEYLNATTHLYAELKGICFDDLTGHFLTNRQVSQALETVCATYRNNKPIDVLCCDACLMAGTGFAYNLKPFGKPHKAQYLVSSQEVVLATGYPYTQMMLRLAQGPTTPHDFAVHTVATFGNAYSKITQDYTQSAVALSEIDDLYESIDSVAQILIDAMNKETNKSVRNFLKHCITRNNCTFFEEPSYKDLNHLFCNMRDNLGMIQLRTQQETHDLRNKMSSELKKTLTTLTKVVVANTAGKNLSKASGLSIYFPETRLHQSYQYTEFAQNLKWYNMLQTYFKGL